MWPRWSLRRSKVCLYLFLGKRFIFGKTGRFPSRGSNLDLSTIVVFQSMSPATIGRASAQVGRSRSRSQNTTARAILYPSQPYLEQKHHRSRPKDFGHFTLSKLLWQSRHELRAFDRLLGTVPRLLRTACQACTGAEQRGSRSRPFCIRLLLG